MFPLCLSLSLSRSYHHSIFNGTWAEHMPFITFLQTCAHTPLFYYTPIPSTSLPLSLSLSRFPSRCMCVAIMSNDRIGSDKSFVGLLFALFPFLVTSHHFSLLHFTLLSFTPSVSSSERLYPCLSPLFMPYFNNTDSTNSMADTSHLMIRNVWADNLEREMALIRNIVDRYPFIAMASHSLSSTLFDLFLLKSSCIYRFEHVLMSFCYGNARIPNFRVW